MTEEPRHDAPTSGDVIRGHFILESDDVRRAVWEVNKGRRALVVIFLLWGFIWLVPGYPWWIPFFGIACTTGGALLGYRRAASNVMANKTERERDITWEFEDVGYRVTTPGSEGRGGWETVHRMVEGETTFFLYVASNIFQIIPKRAFRNQDLPRIRELVRTRVTPRPVKNYAWRLLVLWVALVVAFLAIWQFMKTPQRSRSGSRSTPRTSTSSIKLE